MPEIESVSITNEALSEKQQALSRSLKAAGKLLVAYSGGTDSAYLAYRAHQVLGSEMLAVIADSPSLARADLKSAIDFAQFHQIPLQIVQTNELDDPAYTRNGSDRCFHCKDELFEVMSRICESMDFTNMAYGMNIDDRGDFRPGQIAAVNHNVIAPLAEAGLTKSEVRLLARQAGLTLWDKPAAACLSSRIAYGLPVTPETLDRIEKSEAVLSELGFRQFRVRHHGDLARIEIAHEEMDRILSSRLFDQVSNALKKLGYKFVTLDMEGFRSGSMNSLLPNPQSTGLLAASEIGWSAKGIPAQDTKLGTDE